MADETLEVSTAPEQPANPNNAVPTAAESAMESVISKLMTQYTEGAEPAADAADVAVTATEPTTGDEQGEPAEATVDVEVTEAPAEEAMAVTPEGKRNVLELTPEQLMEYTSKAVQQALKDANVQPPVETPAAAEEVDPFDTTVEFTAEEQALLEANPLLSKSIENMLSKYHKSVTSKVKKELADMKAKFGVIDASVAEQTQQATVGKVKETVGDAFEQKINHPKWGTFLTGQVPFQPKGVTYDMVMRHAIASNDEKRIIDVFNAFDIGQAPAAPKKAAKPAPVAVPPLAASLMPQGSVVDPVEKAKATLEAANKAAQENPNPDTYSALIKAQTTYFNQLNK